MRKEWRLMFGELEEINSRPEPFEFYTAEDLWTDEHTSKKMLSFHLNEEVDISSRNSAFIERSVEWIASHFNIEAGTKIVDFGCGPGLYTTMLAKLQADVTGIDFSERSIQYAQKMAEKGGLNIHYINRNYLEFETDDRFDLVMMIMCDFCALSPAQRQKMLSKFYTILQTGGSVLLDVYSLAAFEQREETAMYEANLLNGFWSPSKYYGFLNTFKYEKEKVVLDKYTIVEAERIRTVYNWLHYFSPEALEREFVERGFRVEDFYADVAGSTFNPESAEFSIVARKP
jgi:cyclopropane fatty-acyl-phospholipid synthase-like methyltransferase